MARTPDARLLGKVARHRACAPGLGARLIDRTRELLIVVLEGGDAAKRLADHRSCQQREKPVGVGM